MKHPPTSTRYWRPTLSCLVLSLCCMWAPSIGAQPQPSGESSQGLAPPLVNPTVLDARWEQFRAAPSGSPDEQRAFDALRNAQAELGLTNLSDHAGLLLAAARMAAEEGDTGRAERLLDFARQLAPHAAAIDFAQADIEWNDAPWAVWTPLGAALSGLGKAWSSPADRPAAELHVLRLVIAFCVALVFIFLVIQVARYARLTSYDLSSKLSHVVSRGWSWIALMTALALPGVLFQSPLLLLVLGFLVVWPYQSRSELVVTFLLLALAALVPQMTERMGTVVAVGTSQVVDISRAERGPCPRPCRAALDEMVQHGPQRDYARLAAATVRFRSGSASDLDEAAALLRGHDFPPSLQPSAALLAGNLLVARGDLLGARGSYESLLSNGGVAPQLELAAHVNLYRVLTDLDRLQQAERHLSDAYAIDQARATAVLDQTERRVNRWLMTVPVQDETVMMLAEQRAAAHAAPAVREAWRPLGGRLPPSTMSLITLFVALLLVGGVVIRRRFASARPCPTCGAVMSPRDAPDATQAGYCPDCYTLFLAGASLDRNERETLEARVEGHRIKSRVWTIAGNVLMPGSGFLSKGRADLALPSLALWVAGAVCFLVASPVASRWFGLPADRFDGRVVVGAACWLIAYGVVLGILLVRRRSALISSGNQHTSTEWH